jgi:hypothetical protein
MLRAWDCVHIEDVCAPAKARFCVPRDAHLMPAIWMAALRLI